MMRERLDQATLVLRTKERDDADARKVAAEAQLASLESRVNPHFLFNTLNSIAALTHDDPAGAERMTNQLASLMRSSLDSASTPLVPLEQELRVVRDYLQIEQVRFGERLRFTIDVPVATQAWQVPRLSLQTLVENSVKFAVSPRREGAAIAIRAAATDTGLRLEVEGDGPGSRCGPAGQRTRPRPAPSAARDLVRRPGHAARRQPSGENLCRAGSSRRPPGMTGMLRGSTSSMTSILPSSASTSRLLQATGRVQLVGSTIDPEAALAFLRTNDIDLLFSGSADARSDRIRAAGATRSGRAGCVHDGVRPLRA